MNKPLDTQSAQQVFVQGKLIDKLPEDLYIPPDALRVFLEETFEGPLDLLLYLIKKQNLDILDIPIAKITKQYIEYIDLMETLSFDLAAEYLVMAAMLAEIKSRMLLPKPISDDGIEEDPRAELVRRLQEYELYKKAAELMDSLPRRGRDTFAASALVKDVTVVRPLVKIELQDLVMAFKDVMANLELRKAHQVALEPLSIRDRMDKIIDALKNNKFISFCDFFTKSEGKLGVVVTFIAILELFKEALIEVVQAEPYAPIHIRSAAACNS